jgi:hypothetical protein
LVTGQNGQLVLLPADFNLFTNKLYASDI